MLQPLCIGPDARWMSFTETLCIAPSSGREGRACRRSPCPLQRPGSGGKQDGPQHKLRMPHRSGRSGPFSGSQFQVPGCRWLQGNGWAWQKALEACSGLRTFVLEAQEERRWCLLAPLCTKGASGWHSPWRSNRGLLPRGCVLWLRRTRAAGGCPTRFAHWPLFRVCTRNPDRAGRGAGDPLV